MSEADRYEDYLERWGAVRARRKKLEPEAFAELAFEYERLLARMDPADIQLDEWKRAEELRFLLVLPADEDAED